MENLKHNQSSETYLCNEFPHTYLPAPASAMISACQFSFISFPQDSFFFPEMFESKFQFICKYFGTHPLQTGLFKKCNQMHVLPRKQYHQQK